MCEQDRAMARGAARDWSVDRRRFAALGLAGGVGAALAGCAATTGAMTGPMIGGADADDRKGLREDMVRITTPDGVMDALFIRPATGRHPAILTWPDIAGLRDAFAVMGRRLARQGHAVLIANPYYRDVAPRGFKDFADFLGQDGFRKVAPWRAKLTADAIGRDAAALIGWLDAQPSVDTTRRVGTHGYCMGGPFTVWTAAAVPDRVGAAASLHGGGLVRDAADSPHRMLAASRAAHLFAIGRDDDAEAPSVKTTLAEAARAAGRPAEIEVYPADHGWTVLDSPAYDEAAAERAWGRMSALFTTL